MSERKLTAIGTRRKGGPTTPEGRERALAARIRGKLPHSAMIVPGAETAEEWDGFRLSVVAEYQPVGALETELADRIAHQLWRLRRFARYEADRATWRLKFAEVEYDRIRAHLVDDLQRSSLPSPLPYKPADAPWLVRVRRLASQALWYIDPDNSDTPNSAQHEDGAQILIRTAAEAAGIPQYNVPDKSDWTTGDVRHHLDVIATSSGMSKDKVLDGVLILTTQEWAKRASEVSSSRVNYEKALAEFKRTLLLPTEAEVKNASRWESHLERSLCRMMDRLERLQRMRAGEALPAPALIDVSLDRD